MPQAIHVAGALLARVVEIAAWSCKVAQLWEQKMRVTLALVRKTQPDH
jgi:hypothetical protein